MSIFGRLFGGAKAEDEKKRADALFEAKQFYEAKTAYENAIDARDATDALKKTLAARVEACRDALAEARIREAEEHLRHGDLGMARTELANAMEVAASERVRREAERRLEKAERKDAQAQAQADEEPTDDERILLLAAQWEEAQQAEYDEYGERFRAALVAMEKGENERARDELEAMKAEHADDDPPPVYLYLELARARQRCEDDEGTAKALRTFLKRVPEDDRSEARVRAYEALALIADRAGDEEKAMKQYEKGIEAMADDPRPYLQFGVYLRLKGHAAEAISLLDLAIDHMDEDRPSWLAHQELGLAHRDAGNDAKAVEVLEKVVRFFVQRGTTDLPVATAMALAELSEKQGNDVRAADLYSSLARGSDKANHLAYHRHAARVLERLGLDEEARRMLVRAAGLAEKDAAAAEEIRRALARLDGEDEGGEDGDEDDDE